MASFGEKLRRERELRKVTLDEIAAVTKIGTRSLKALEDENFAILPGGIFNKGFVRSYARFLGMDEDQAVADYQAAANEQPVSVQQIADQSAMAKASRLAAQQAGESSNSAGLIRAAVIFVLVLGATFGLYKAFRHGAFKALKRPSLHRQMKQQAQAPAANPVATPAPATAPVVNSAAPTQSAASAVAPVEPKKAPVTVAKQAPAPISSTSTTAPVTAAAVEFTVSIKTTDSSWLSVMADGKRAVQRLFAANDQENVTAKNKMSIRIGDPSVTELSLNGKPLPIEGDLHHPRTIIVDANGITSE